jgi:CRISPR-associated endonuclease/helicase Cas3
MVEVSLDELKDALRRVLDPDEPYEHQLEFGREVLAGRNVILSAGTGSGKTEAALVPALLELDERRIFLLYPTKALLQDQRKRVEEIVGALGQQVLGREPRIIVDTGDEDDPTGYSADIILTNLDKFVYRLFGYGKKRWGYIYPYRLTHDARKPLLVFDEAHAYEETIFSHFWFVLNKLTYERRVQTLLLSATLPESFIEALRDDEFEAFPRPESEGDFFALVKDEERRSGRQFYRGIVSQEEAASRAADLFREGRRVVIIFRRIAGKGGLQEAWKNLRERVGAEMARAEGDGIAGSVLAYHGGQLPGYRRRVLNRLLHLDDKREPYLLIATHAMEVGVDISTESMFCGTGEGDFVLGPESFVQQIGRCARRPDENGNVYLVVGEEGETPKFAKVLEVDAEISPETKSLLNAMNEPPSAERAERSVEYLHDEALYRYVYDHVPENAQIWERGTLVTREWEPSIELVFSEMREDDTYIGGIPQQRFWRGGKMKESLSLPIRRAASLAPFCAWVFTGQDEDNDSPLRVALGGEKQRSLGEALAQLGYPIPSDANRYSFQDARQVPLTLLMPESYRGENYVDDNLGLVTWPGDTKEIHFGNPNIRRYEIALKKNNPSTSLILRWEEPWREEV